MGPSSARIAATFWASSACGSAATRSGCAKTAPGAMDASAAVTTSTVEGGFRLLTATSPPQRVPHDDSRPVGELAADESRAEPRALDEASQIALFGACRTLACVLDFELLAVAVLRDRK